MTEISSRMHRLEGGEGKASQISFVSGPEDEEIDQESMIKVIRATTDSSVHKEADALLAEIQSGSGFDPGSSQTSYQGPLVCPVCGADLHPDDLFCPECGNEPRRQASVSGHRPRTSTNYRRRRKELGTGWCSPTGCCAPIINCWDMCFGRFSVRDWVIIAFCGVALTGLGFTIGGAFRLGSGNGGMMLGIGIFLMVVSIAMLLYVLLCTSKKAYKKHSEDASVMIHKDKVVDSIGGFERPT